MSFALICILMLVGLGVVAAVASIGDKDEPIVEAHDCGSCASKDDGSCKIACLMEEKRKKDQAAKDAAKAMTILVCLLVMTSCSTKKNTSGSRFWQSFTAKYNTYYNGTLAYIDGSEEKEKGNKDNFTEMLPLYTVGNKASRTIGGGNFDRAIEKSEKAIKQHSIKAKPKWTKSRRKTDKDKEWLSRKEYNPFLWRAWLMLGKSQFQKGNFDEAAATFSYMSRLYQTQPDINGIARSWLARSYMELDWMYDAEDVIRNMSRDSIHYKAKNDWDYTFANYYIKNGEYRKGAEYLRKAIKHERRKVQKARMWYLMAQVETQQGHRQEAYKAYQKCIRQNPPYELEFNARIAQTEVMAKGNSKKMIARLRSMARNDNNKDYLDQVYYAIGNIYLAQKDTMRAIGAYETGNEKATRSGIEKGVLLLKLGNLYWEMERYNDAQRCYGEAIGLLDKDRDDYEELSQRSKVLDELVPHTDAVHLQDSLQALAKMSEKDRNAAIDRVIEALKKKEKEERDKALEAEVESALQKQGAVGNRNQAQRTPPTVPGSQKNGQWYFYNQLAVNQGKQQFQSQWGKRENADHWQRNNKTVVSTTDFSMSSDDAATDSLSADGTPLAADSIDMAAAPTDSLDAKADSAANDPHKREYYLAQIPFTDEQVQESNLIIMDGLFNSGVIFKDKLENLRLAEKQLVRLTSDYTDFEKTDEAWYHLFLLYSLRGDTEMAQACLMKLQEGFPDSDWTILLSDPYFVENARFGEHIEDSLYGATYDAFKRNNFSMVKANEKLSAERFPLGNNRAKFIFINALGMLNEGDAPGCAEQLKTVVEKFPQSEVSELAGMIIKGIQEGRQLYGGTFDLNDIWSRRDLTLNADSASTDTLSADRLTNFVFLMIYHPDSILVSENQLLYEVARYNFSNFLVRNFDIQTEHEAGFGRMTISGFLSFDEALQYARQLRSSAEMAQIVQRCRTVVISEHNLSLIGSRYSFRDYEEFYQQTFEPLQISNEELLNMPTEIKTEDEDSDSDTDDGESETPTNPSANGGFDFGDDFF